MSNTTSKNNSSPLPEKKTSHRTINFDQNRLSRTLFTLALPAVVENILSLSVYIIDAILVGHLHSESALAGTVLSGTIMMLIQTPFQAMGVATIALVARSWGEQDIPKARRYARQSISIAWILSLVLAIVGFLFAFQMIHWMKAAPDVIQAGGSFMRIIILSLPFQIPMFICSGIFRGSGDTRTPMYITGIINVLNVLISWVLAFGIGPFPKMGLMGVAWGTMIAQSVGGMIALTILVQGWSNLRIPIWGLFTWNKNIIHQIWVIAYPVMIERFIATSAQVVFYGIITRLGTTALAAHNVALRVESIAFQPPWGVNIAVATIVGQALGARQTQFAELTVKKGLQWIGIGMAFLSVAFLLFSHQFVQIFGATPEVLRQSGIVLKIAAVEFPFIAFFAVLSGCLRGAGDTRSPLYVMLICLAVFRFGVVYLFAVVFNWGLPGVWWATTLDWMARAGGLWYVFHKGAWKYTYDRLLDKKI